MRSIHALLGPISIIALASSAWTAKPSSDGACFTAKDNAGLPFEVIQLAPPPPAKDSGYANYPLTGVATMQLGKLATRGQGYARYHFQWANRSNVPLHAPSGRLLPRKPNVQPSFLTVRRQRTAFTSMERANACTLAQTASVLGLSKRAQSYGRRAGLTLISEAQQPDAGAQGPDDRCVLAAGRLPTDATGVVLDYEAQDGRSGAQTMAFLKAFAALVQGAGKKAVLLINPFDAPSQRYSGISAANANAIVKTFDKTTIWLWGRNRQGSIPASYAAQKAMIAAGGTYDAKRLIVDFDLAGATLADAKFVHDAILRDGLAGVMLFRNGARQGGACSSEVNRKIAALIGR